MFAPPSGQPLSTHAPDAAKYTLYLLFIHRERFLVFILWNGCVLPRTKVSRCDTKHYLVANPSFTHPLQKQIVTSSLNTGHYTHRQLDSVFFFSVCCVVLRCGNVVSIDARFVLRSAMMRARLFMEEVRVNERAPSAGVAYCTPASLGPLVWSTFFQSPCA